jgi:hypothetical protein
MRDENELESFGVGNEGEWKEWTFVLSNCLTLFSHIFLLIITICYCAISKCVRTSVRRCTALLGSCVRLLRACLFMVDPVVGVGEDEHPLPTPRLGIVCTLLKMFADSYRPATLTQRVIIPTFLFL